MSQLSPAVGLFHLVLTDDEFGCIVAALHESAYSSQASDLLERLVELRAAKAPVTQLPAQHQLTLSNDEACALRCLLAWGKSSPRVSPAVARDLVGIEKRLENLRA